MSHDISANYYSAHSLYKARLVWFALFKVSPEKYSGWREWADRALLMCKFTPPIWLVNLAEAASSAEAMAAISDCIGVAKTEDSWKVIHVDALLFGFVYEKAKEHALSESDMWDALKSIGDIAQFLDAGEWRRFQVDTEINLNHMSREARHDAMLEPIALAAVGARSMLFNHELNSSIEHPLLG